MAYWRCRRRLEDIHTYTHRQTQRERDAYTQTPTDTDNHKHGHRQTQTDTDIDTDHPWWSWPSLYTHIPHTFPTLGSAYMRSCGLKPPSVRVLEYTYLHFLTLLCSSLMALSIALALDAFPRDIRFFCSSSFFCTFTTFRDKRQRV